MRVTKIVREYIEESVAKKYQPAEDSIVKRYEPMERAYDEAVKAAKAEIKKVWEKSLSPFYTKEELERVIDDHTVYVPSSYHVDMAWRQERSEREYDLRKAKEKTIRDIMIKLELGGTKEDLDKMLSEIDPEEKEK